MESASSRSRGQLFASYRMNRGGESGFRFVARQSVGALDGAKRRCEEPGRGPQIPKNKNANGDRHQPCKNAVEGQQGSDCDHMGAHKGLAHVDE